MLLDARYRLYGLAGHVFIFFTNYFSGPGNALSQVCVCTLCK